MYVGLPDSEEIDENGVIINSFDESSRILSIRDMKELMKSHDEFSHFINSGLGLLSNSFDESTCYLNTQDGRKLTLSSEDISPVMVLQDVEKTACFTDKVNLSCDSQKDEKSFVSEIFDSGKKKEDLSSKQQHDPQKQEECSHSYEPQNSILNTEDDIDEDWSLDGEDDFFGQKIKNSVLSETKTETEIAAGDKKDFSQQDCLGVIKHKTVASSTDDIDTLRNANHLLPKDKKPRQRYKVRFFSHLKKNEGDLAIKTKPKKQYFEIRIRPPRTMNSLNEFVNPVKLTPLSTIPSSSSSNELRANIGKETKMLHVDQRALGWDHKLKSQTNSKQNCKKQINGITNGCNFYRYPDRNTSNTYTLPIPPERPKQNVKQWLSKFVRYLKRNKPQPPAFQCKSTPQSMMQWNSNYFLYDLDREDAIDEIYNISQRINYLTHKEFLPRIKVGFRDCKVENYDKFGTNRSNTFPYVATDSPVRTRPLKRKVVDVANKPRPTFSNDCIGEWTPLSDAARRTQNYTADYRNEFKREMKNHEPVPNVRQGRAKTVRFVNVSDGNQSGSHAHNLRLLNQQRSGVSLWSEYLGNHAHMSSVDDGQKNWLNSTQERFDDFENPILTSDEWKKLTSVPFMEFQTNEAKTAKSLLRKRRKRQKATPHRAPHRISNTTNHIHHTSQGTLPTKPSKSNDSFIFGHPGFLEDSKNQIQSIHNTFSKNPQISSTISAEYEDFNTGHYPKKSPSGYQNKHIHQDSRNQYLLHSTIPLSNQNIHRIPPKASVFSNSNEEIHPELIKHVKQKQRQLHNMNTPQGSTQRSSFSSTISSGPIIQQIPQDPFMQNTPAASQENVQRDSVKYGGVCHCDICPNDDSRYPSAIPNDESAQNFQQYHSTDANDGIPKRRRSRSFHAERSSEIYSAAQQVSLQFIETFHEESKKFLENLLDSFRSKLAIDISSGNYDEMARNVSGENNYKSVLERGIQRSHSSQELHHDMSLGVTDRNRLTKSFDRKSLPRTCDKDMDLPDAHPHSRAHAKSIHRVSTCEERFLMHVLDTSEERPESKADNDDEAQGRFTDEEKHFIQFMKSEAGQRDSSISRSELSGVTEKAFLMKQTSNAECQTSKYTPEKGSSSHSHAKATNYSTHNQEGSSNINGMLAEEAPFLKIKKTKHTDGRADLSLEGDGLANSHEMQGDIKQTVDDDKRTKTPNLQSERFGKKNKKSKVSPCCMNADSSPSSPYSKGCFSANQHYQFHPVIQSFDPQTRDIAKKLLEQGTDEINNEEANKTKPSWKYCATERSLVKNKTLSLPNKGDSNFNKMEGDILQSVPVPEKEKCALATARGATREKPRRKSFFATHNLRFHPHISKDQLQCDMQRKIIFAHKNSLKSSNNANEEKQVIPDVPVNRTQMAERMGHLNTAIISKMQPCHDDLQAIRTATRCVKEIARLQEYRMAQLITQEPENCSTQPA